MSYLYTSRSKAPSPPAASTSTSPSYPSYSSSTSSAFPPSLSDPRPHLSPTQATQPPRKTFAYRYLDATKHEQEKPKQSVTVTPVRSVSSSSASDIDASMAKRKGRRETPSLSPPSPPSTPADMTRPTTPTSPVQIPKQANRDMASSQKRRTGHHRPQRPVEVHDPNSISPSLAALLAVTDIPRPRQRRRRRNDTPLTVEDVIDRQQVSEKELSWSLSRRPMDLLLSPPEELGEDDVSISDSNIGSVLSTRTVSAESFTSLGDSYMTDGLSSIGTPGSQSPLSSRRRSGPARKMIEPIRSPPDEAVAHPLQHLRTPDDFEFEEFSFKPLEQPVDQASAAQYLGPFKPLRSVFKSNLTASLRALRSAARSFSSINFSSIPPDDLLTRSLLTIDPNVPYMDERRPPVTEEAPSAELRRYLNPTTSTRLEAQPANLAPRKFSASIQMQTYKVHRSQSAPPTTRTPSPAAPSPSQTPVRAPQPQSPGQTAFSYPPGMRQREMRENSDFIRIAVMEMAMRKRGKLDDQRPGRARWALPPRRTAMKTYEVGADGVPARWASTSC